MVLEAELKNVLIFDPRAVIAPMQTTAMRRNKRAYSAIETPSSPRPNLLTAIKMRGMVPHSVLVERKELDRKNSRRRDKRDS
jgi:hypothetical protein